MSVHHPESAIRNLPQLPKEADLRAIVQGRIHQKSREEISAMTGLSVNTIVAYSSNTLMEAEGNPDGFAQRFGFTPEEVRQFILNAGGRYRQAIRQYDHVGARQVAQMIDATEDMKLWILTAHAQGMNLHTAAEVVEVDIKNLRPSYYQIRKSLHALIEGGGVSEKDLEERIGLMGLAEILEDKPRGRPATRAAVKQILSLKETPPRTYPDFEGEFARLAKIAATEQPALYLSGIDIAYLLGELSGLRKTLDMGQIAELITHGTGEPVTQNQVGAVYDLLKSHAR